MDISNQDVKNFINELASNKDWLYIFQPCSIGDVLFNGGLSKAVQNRKNKKATVLVIQERMKNLGITYENLADIIYLPKAALDVIMHYCYITGDYEGDNYIYGHFHNAGKGYIWDVDLPHILARYKKNILNVPLDTLFTPPLVSAISEQNIAELNDKYILDKARTIIISPYVHSIKQLDMSFWEVLVTHLKNRGYIVYTNTDGIKEIPVAGTKAMNCNLPEVNFISDKIRVFIGSRSGFIDFLAMTKAKIICITPLICDDGDLKLMYPNCISRTFYNAVDYVQPAIEYLQRKKFTASIKISHPLIRQQDIFFDYEDILGGILAEVETI